MTVVSRTEIRNQLATYLALSTAPVVAYERARSPRAQARRRLYRAFAIRAAQGAVFGAASVVLAVLAWT